MHDDSDELDIEQLLTDAAHEYDDCLERDPTWVIDGRGVSDCHAYMTVRLISSDGYEALVHVSVHELLAIRSSVLSDKPRKSVVRDFQQITLDEAMPRFQIPASKIESVLSRLLDGESQTYIAIEEEVNRRTVARIDQVNRDEGWNFVFPGDEKRVADWQARTNAVLGVDNPSGDQPIPDKGPRQHSRLEGESGGADRAHDPSACRLPQPERPADADSRPKVESPDERSSDLGDGLREFDGLPLFDQ